MGTPTSYLSSWLFTAQSWPLATPGRSRATPILLSYLTAAAAILHAAQTPVPPQLMHFPRASWGGGGHPTLHKVNLWEPEKCSSEVQDLGAPGSQD